MSRTSRSVPATGPRVSPRCELRQAADERIFLAELHDPDAVRVRLGHAAPPVGRLWDATIVLRASRSSGFVLDDEHPVEARDRRTSAKRRRAAGRRRGHVFAREPPMRLCEEAADRASRRTRRPRGRSRSLRARLPHSDSTNERRCPTVLMSTSPCRTIRVTPSSRVTSTTVSALQIGHSPVSVIR